MKIGDTTNFLTLLAISSSGFTGQFRCTRCGNERAYAIARVQSHELKSCGCYRSDFASEIQTIHGRHGTEEYEVWSHLKAHARRTGAEITPRWDTFLDFLEDMGEMPKGTDHLARYKLDQPFSKENCVWAGHSETMMTKRPHANNKTGIKGLALKKERGVYKCYQAHIAAEQLMYSKRFPLTNQGFLSGVAWLVLMREALHGQHANHFIESEILEEASAFFSDPEILSAVDYSLKHPSTRQ